MTTEITGHPDLEWLNVTTPGQYAMDLAIETLEYLDNQQCISVKNTGWKNGFGLEVCAWIPIHATNCNAELMTDGDSFQLRKISGNQEGFNSLLNTITEFLKENHNAI